MGRRNDWDSELSRDTKQRRNNRRRRKSTEDEDFMNRESSEFVRSLESSKGTGWMAEKKYKRMFSEIEDGLSGVLGDGPFEWVDRRVFDAVFDRLTLLSLYKLMKSGIIDTLDFPIARGKEAHVFHGTGENGPIAVKIFHTSNAVFKNLVLIGAGMTGFYMSRMWFMTFAGKPKTEVAEHVHEQTPWIPIPLVVLTFMTLSAVILAGMHAGKWLGDFDNGNYKNFFDGIGYELSHIFLNENRFIMGITYVVISLSLILGPYFAMSLYGGRLDDGQKAKPWMQWAVNLSGRINERSSFDNTAWANSSLAHSLHKRLHFDDVYDAAMLKIVVGFSKLAAIFDSRFIDGVIKAIESTSQIASTKVRSLTTGSARDYIMMTALGTLVIFMLLWGVA